MIRLVYVLPRRICDVLSETICDGICDVSCDKSPKLTAPLTRHDMVFTFPGVSKNGGALAQSLIE
jgi:hypothetical protein